jgi:hypothetical protein
MEAVKIGSMEKHLKILRLLMPNFSQNLFEK